MRSIRGSTLQLTLAMAALLFVYLGTPAAAGGDGQREGPHPGVYDNVPPPLEALADSVDRAPENAISYWLELAEPFERPGPAQMHLVVIADTAYCNRNACPEELTFRIDVSGGLQCLSSTVMTVNRGGAARCEITVSLIVPDDTLSRIRLTREYDNGETFPCGSWFFSCLGGRGYYRGRSHYESDEERLFFHPEDTMTYRAKFDLRDPELRQKILGWAEENGVDIQPTADEGFYLWRETEERLRSVEREIDYELIDIPPLRQDTTLYDISMDLSDPGKYQVVKRLADSLGRELIRDTLDSFYILKLHRHKAAWLKFKEINFHYKRMPPPLPEDSLRRERKLEQRKMRKQEPKRLPRPDQSNLGRSDAGMYVGCIHGTDDFDRIYAGEEVQIEVWGWNYTGQPVWGIDNGFRVYSTDGADWEYLEADWSGPLDWDDVFAFPMGSYYVLYNNITGTGADTARMFGYGSGNGIPDGFEDHLYTFSVGPFEDSDAGRHLCFDSSWVAGTGLFRWALEDGNNVAPWWVNDPYCWEIRDAGDVYLHGQLVYENPTPVGAIWESLRNIRVDVWTVDHYGADDFEGTFTTDDLGYYSFGPISRAWHLGGPDIYFVVWAMNSATIVRDQTGDRLSFQSDTLVDIGAGDHEFQVWIEAPDSKPFFVADCEYEGYTTWTLARPPVESLDSADTYIGPSYTNSSNAGWITINDYVGDTGFTSAYNRSTIVHEYGHFVSRNFDIQETQLGFFRSGGGAHTFPSCYDLGKSASEGWADFFSGWVFDDPVYRIWRDEFANYWWWNFETCEYYKPYDNYPHTGSVNAMGACNASGEYDDESNEGAVAGILWDIYDHMDDDYSSRSDWGQLQNTSNPDGIGDELSNGIDLILSALCDDDRMYLYGTALYHPNDMLQFWDCWFQEPSLGYMSEMTDIFYEHGIKIPCCSGRTGNIDGLAVETDIDIADLVYLIAYMFSGGPHPICMFEANVDGIGDLPDIADLVYLISYMFTGGPEPVECD